MTREEIAIRFTPVIDVALEAGRKLRLKLDAMKQALKEGDEQKALGVARDICGIEQQDQHAPYPRRRTPPRLHG